MSHSHKPAKPATKPTEVKVQPEEVKPTEQVKEMVQEVKNVKPTNEAEGFDAAIIYKSGNEVRRYSISQHGKDFYTLAKQYAEKKGCTIKLLTLKTDFECPKCGHKFNLNR